MYWGPQTRVGIIEVMETRFYILIKIGTDSGLEDKWTTSNNCHSK